MLRHWCPRYPYTHSSLRWQFGAVLSAMSATSAGSRVRRCLVGLSDTVSFNQKEKRKKGFFILSPRVPSVPLDLHRSGGSAEMRHFRGRRGSAVVLSGEVTDRASVSKPSRSARTSPAPRVRGSSSAPVGIGSSCQILQRWSRACYSASAAHRRDGRDPPSNRPTGPFSARRRGRAHHGLRQIRERRFKMDTTCM